MNFVLFGVRSARRGGNLKRQVRSETSLNLRCAARVADTSLTIFHPRRISPRSPLTGITRHKDCVAQIYSLTRRFGFLR